MDIVNPQTQTEDALPEQATSPVAKDLLPAEIERAAATEDLLESNASMHR